MNKKTTAIALLLMLTFAVSIVALPATNAHTPPWEIYSYPYIVPAPNPVGVGQQVLIVMWVDEPMPSATATNDIKRHGYTLTITAPDETKEVKEWDVVWDSTSIQYVAYTPTQVGTYTLLFEYDGQNYTWGGTYNNDVFLPCSKTVTLTVQEESLPAATTSYPLPTEYWTRPIEGQNTDWWSISSNWLGDPYILGAGDTYGTQGSIQPNGIAPNSPHIMWSKPIQDGGVVGGSGYHVNGTTYYMGGSYNMRFANPLVMHGRLYYELPLGNSGGGGGWICVDLRTGEEIWYGPMGVSGSGYSDPNFGYLYDYDHYNQHGVIPNGWLFTSNWGMAYDPATGKNVSLSLSNVPTSNQVIGPHGEILSYQWSNLGNSSYPNYYLAQWNSSLLFISQTSGTLTANVPITPARPTIGANSTNPLTTWTYNATSGQWTSSTTTSSSGRNWYWKASGTPSGWIYTQSSSMTAARLGTNTAPCYNWNVSIQGLGPGTWSVNRVSYDNIMLVTQGSFGDRGATDGANITAISLKSDSVGSVLWTRHYDVAPNDASRSIAEWDPENGVFVMRDKEPLTLRGFSLEDGRLLWGPTEPMNDYTYFRTDTYIAYGRVYSACYGGILYCWDVKNGSLLWTYGNGGEGNSTFSGLETAWGRYPVFVDVIADGKIYLSTTEHSPGAPFYKDTKYRCVDAYTGEEIWTLMGWGTGMDPGCDVVADGFFVFLNCYDMKVYSVGKGPSALTVTAPDAGLEFGKSLVIRGTVMDIAAGTKQDEQAARFPNGVPAVSDESMGKWMEYVYMQKPRPADAAGVPVTIDVIDSNGNYRTIGTPTSDSSGMFTFSWVPDIPGDFKVIATFAGSESYWPSFAETSFTVMEAPEPTPAPTSEPANTAELYFVPATAGIIVAIAVVGVVLMLMLRKR
jgi:hypothetical protein